MKKLARALHTHITTPGTTRTSTETLRACVLPPAGSRHGVGRAPREGSAATGSLTSRDLQGPSQDHTPPVPQRATGLRKHGCARCLSSSEQMGVGVGSLQPNAAKQARHPSGSRAGRSQRASAHSLCRGRSAGHGPPRETGGELRRRSPREPRARHHWKRWVEQRTGWQGNTLRPRPEQRGARPSGGETQAS